VILTVVLGSCSKDVFASIATGDGNFGDGNGAVLCATICVSAEGAAAIVFDGVSTWPAAALFPRLFPSPFPRLFPSVPAIAGEATVIFESGGGTEARATICVCTAGIAVLALGAGGGKCPEGTFFASFTGTLTVTLPGVIESSSMVCVLADGPAAAALGNDGTGWRGLMF
jgi:hypothetical protein